MPHAPVEAGKSIRSAAVARDSFIVPGFRVASAASGMRYQGRPDVALIVAEPEATAAAVFTRNRFCAAPVRLCRQHLAQSRQGIRAVLVNAGIANACTGQEGDVNAQRSAQQLAAELGTDPSRILVASTGVIGPQIRVEPLFAVLPELHRRLAEDGWDGAARAILTTDTVAKLASTRLDLYGKTVTIGGICKGSGMIAPDMATMLAFVCTDAAVQPEILDHWLRLANAETFNAISVDGDTSTNDTLIVLAGGGAGHLPIDTMDSAESERFGAALQAVLADLSRQIVLDGEGATKLVEICVSGARSVEEARRVAFTVADSPLVKTAFFGQDPNWGRVVAAAGRAGVELDPDKVTLCFGDVTVFRDGMPLLSKEVENAAARVLQEREITVALRLGQGDARFCVRTCDFSYDYVRINADYRS